MERPRCAAVRAVPRLSRSPPRARFHATAQSAAPAATPSLRRCASDNMNIVLKSSDISQCRKVRITARLHESGGCGFAALGTKPSPGSAQLSDPQLLRKAAGGTTPGSRPDRTSATFFFLKIGEEKTTNQPNATKNN